MPNQDLAKGAAWLIALALRVLGPVKTVTYSICHGQAPWERTKLIGGWRPSRTPAPYPLPL